VSRSTADLEAPLFIVAGLYGSASTWAYNAVRLLLSNESPIVAGYSDTARELPEGAPGLTRLVKCHLPDTDLRQLARARRAGVVITVRDPRDALVSTVARFALPRLDIHRALVVSAARLTALASTCPCTVLRYETRFPSHVETVEALARSLGIEVTGSRASEISDTLSADKVRTRIATLAAEGAFGPDPRPIDADPVTQWHPTHLGDGRVGKHAEVLSDEEGQALLRETAAFCTHFGYP